MIKIMYCELYKKRIIPFFLALFLGLQLVNLFVLEDIPTIEPVEDVKIETNKVLECGDK